MTGKSQKARVNQEKGRSSGRLSVFSQKTADEIINRLSAGETLKKICADDKMPHMATVFRWLAKGKEDNAPQEIVTFCDMYARAREVMAATIFDEMLEIADDVSKDTKTDEKGNKCADSEWITRSRLRVDTRKFYLSKVLPKVYGDKTEVEHSGGITIVEKKYDWEDDE